MGFVEDMHEAWQYKAAELVRNVAEDLEAYHKRIDAAKDDVCEAARFVHDLNRMLIDDMSDGTTATEYDELGIALAAYEKVRDE